MKFAFNLGRTSTGFPVIWAGGDNPHLSILGRSGSGKSYFLNGLVQQAAQQGALSVVLDYSADFRRYIPPPGISFRRTSVTDPCFTINPLAASAAGGGLTAAQQLLSGINSVFHMGNRAAIALQKSATSYLGQPGPHTLTGLLCHIDTIEKKGVGLRTAIEPLELLSTLTHCGDEPISIDLEQPGIVILGFDHIVDTKMRALLVELILQAVWNQWVSIERSADHPLILVLDECQNLSWGEDSMAVRILREGRKFGIGGWFASQWISNKTAIAALGQAVLQVNFRPEDANIPVLAKRLAESKGTASQWQELIRKLKVGQFLWQRADGRSVVVTVPAQENDPKK